MTALVILPALSARGDDKGDVLAIVVKKGSAITDLSSADLSKIYHGEQTKAPDGTRIILTMREAGSPERAQFLDKVMKMSEGDFQKYFLKAIFTGLVKAAPKEVSGPDGLKTFLGDNDGGIGYMKLSDVDGTVTPVTIDGKKPGDDGYPLASK
jgi:ABC-type phosphate transport system substrate-binding protein